MPTCAPVFALSALVASMMAAPAATPGPTPAHQAIPSSLAAIKAEPANLAQLERTVDIERDPGDEGSEMPPVIYYNPPKEFGTFMAVTDVSLCKIGRAH